MPNSEHPHSYLLKVFFGISLTANLFLTAEVITNNSIKAALTSHLADPEKHETGDTKRDRIREEISVYVKGIELELKLMHEAIKDLSD